MRAPRFLLSRISPRLLAFNVLLVFLPVVGLFLVDTFEKLLLDAQEHAMVQQGRILAVTLSEQGPLTNDKADAVLRRLERRHEARFRIVAQDGVLLADSARLTVTSSATTRKASPVPVPEPAGRSWLYRLGAWPFVFLRAIQPPAPEPSGDSEEFYSAKDHLDGREIRAALQGQYGAATRVSPSRQRSVTLYCAIPVRSGDSVVGAVLVSQSTHRIVQALYLERLTVFKVFLTSLGVAIVLSLLVSATIARPLRRLRDEAESLLDRRGRLRGSFRDLGRPDEIGDLSRSLVALTNRLEEHISFIEGFSADVSHEFRNPLTAIRTAAELADDVEDKDTRRELLGNIQKGVARLERVLRDVREITRIDAEAASRSDEIVEINSFLASLAAAINQRIPGQAIRVVLHGQSSPVSARLSADRLAQVCDNLIDNAVSFSAPNSEVDIRVREREHHLEIAFQDCGPGIPPEHLGRVFDRFFTFRPGDDPHHEHSGLGLAIVRTIVESAGGSVSAHNLAGGGACFVVRLPRA